MKATVIGAAGGIGQPLSLLLKLSPNVTELSVYDVVNAVGVATDLSHIDSQAPCSGFLPENDGLNKALDGTNLVIIPAGIPRKPGMTRDDLFNTNAGIVYGIAEAVAKTAPKAFVLVISNPVNSMVPIFSEVFKKHNVYDPKRLFGVTSLDLVRASTFVSESNGEPSAAPKYKVPVVGGHSGVTIVPLLSQSQPPFKGDQKTIEEVTNHIQFGGDDVVKAKNNTGSATLSMAYAGARFADSILSAAQGKKIDVEYSYIDLTADEAGAKEVKDVIGDKTPFFSVPITLGPNGVEKIHGLGKLSDYESELIKKGVEALEGNITKGISFKPTKL
ncbi:L-malate dehydrogenase [Malassezia pachydermatis]|uniref:malate dehydrogenase n=1 Tax=Malassezia pachydermatis TaxID=77020 RepID=A0A0M8MXQ8_9BASI|nr:nad-malate dehydrogenase [Malassezia pachydermatis]KOS16454.1 nad-malate dehydrogenase [Malassezia pachydermatis]